MEDIDKKYISEVVTAIKQAQKTKSFKSDTLDFALKSLSTKNFASYQIIKRAVPSQNAHNAIFSKSDRTVPEFDRTTGEKLGDIGVNASRLATVQSYKVKHIFNSISFDSIELGIENIVLTTVVPQVAEEIDMLSERYKSVGLAYSPFIDYIVEPYDIANVEIAVLVKIGFTGLEEK